MKYVQHNLLDGGHVGFNQKFDDLYSQTLYLESSYCMLKENRNAYILKKFWQPVNIVTLALITP
jgi:hypothetical protein